MSNGLAVNVMKEAVCQRQDTAKSLKEQSESMNFTACSVPGAAQFHKDLGTGVALLLYSDAERISQGVAVMEGRPPVISDENGSEIVVDRSAKTVTVKGMVTWLIAGGGMAAALTWLMLTFGTSWFSRSTALQVKGQEDRSSEQVLQHKSNQDIRKQLSEILKRLDEEQKP